MDGRIQPPRPLSMQPGPNAFAIRMAAMKSPTAAMPQCSSRGDNESEGMNQTRTYLLPSSSYTKMSPEKSSVIPQDLGHAPVSASIYSARTPEALVGNNDSLSHASSHSSGNMSKPSSTPGRRVSHTRTPSRGIEKRLLQLAQSGGDETANVRRKGPPPAALNLETPKALGKALYRNVKAVGPEATSSESKTFLDRLKGPTLRPNPAHMEQSPEPTKHHLGIAPKAANLFGGSAQNRNSRFQAKSSDVPSKAAKLLGTSSAPTGRRETSNLPRDKSLPKLGDFPIPDHDFYDPDTPTALRKVRSGHGDDDYDKSKSLRDLNQRIAFGSRVEHSHHLRDINQDTPPTPPSKTESQLDRALQARQSMRVPSDDALGPHRRFEPSPLAEVKNVRKGAPELVSPESIQIASHVASLSSFHDRSSRHIARQARDYDESRVASPARPSITYQPASPVKRPDFHGYPSIVGGNPYSPSFYSMPFVPEQGHHQTQGQHANGEHQNAGKAAQCIPGSPEHRSVGIRHTIDSILDLYEDADLFKLYPSPLHVNNRTFSQQTQDDGPSLGPSRRVSPVHEESRDVSSSTSATVPFILDMSPPRQDSATIPPALGTLLPGEQYLDRPSYETMEKRSDPGNDHSNTLPGLRHRTGFDSRSSPERQQRHLPPLQSQPQPRSADQNSFGLPSLSELLRPSPASSEMKSVIESVQDHSDKLENKLDAVFQRLEATERQNTLLIDLLSNLAEKHHDFSLHVGLRLDQLGQQVESVRREMTMQLEAQEHRETQSFERALRMQGTIDNSPEKGDENATPTQSSHHAGASQKISSMDRFKRSISPVKWATPGSRKARASEGAPPTFTPSSSVSGNGSPMQKPSTAEAVITGTFRTDSKARLLDGFPAPPFSPRQRTDEHSHTDHLGPPPPSPKRAPPGPGAARPSRTADTHASPRRAAEPAGTLAPNRSPSQPLRPVTSFPLRPDAAHHQHRSLYEYEYMARSGGVAPPPPPADPAAFYADHDAALPALDPHPGQQVFASPGLDGGAPPWAAAPTNAMTNMKGGLDAATQMAIAPFEFGTAGGARRAPRAWKGPGYASAEGSLDGGVGLGLR